MTSFLISIQTLIGSDGSLVFRGSFPGGTSILVSLRQYSLLAVDSSRRVPRLSNVQDVFQKQRKSTSRSLCRCCRRLKWTRTSNEQDDETQLSVCCLTFGVDKNKEGDGLSITRRLYFPYTLSSLRTSVFVARRFLNRNIFY